MPKETITNHTNDGQVTVGWSREGEYAQLSVSTGQKFVFSDNGDDNSYDRIYFTLDASNRKGFNDLIRALRRARDQVCGKDE